MIFARVIYKLVPLPGVTEEEFEAFMIGEVLPTIDTTYTRGGGIVGLAFHKDAKGDSEPKYLWAIDLETFGGSWFEARLEPAVEKLATVSSIEESGIYERLHAWSFR